MRERKNPATRQKIDFKWLGKTFLQALVLVVWTGIIIVAAQLVIGYLMLWILGRENYTSTIAQAIYTAIVYVVAFLILWLVTPRLIAWVRKGLENYTKRSDSKSKLAKESSAQKQNIATKVANRDELGLKGLPTWTDIGLAPVGFIVTIVLAALITALFSVFPWFDASETQELGFSFYVAGADRLIAMIAMVLIAPIAEELIFRGWLYGKMRAMFTNKFAGRLAIIIPIILVSLVFGILHGQWNVGLTVFAMSVVLCVMREITGTIYAGILLHIIKNAVAFYLVYVMGVGM